MSNEDKNIVYPTDAHASLSGVGGGSGTFQFHLVFFPTASFLSGEGFSVVAVVAWIAAIERGIVNLLPHPSLP
jgi:hypothetical protein